MNEKIGIINSREVWYFKPLPDNSLEDILPSKNWLAFIIVDDNSELLSQVAEKCIQFNVVYVCCTGKEASYAEDVFDWAIVINEIEKERSTGIESDYEDTPMTTAHDSVEEGFWFATCVAYNSVRDVYVDINKVVCIDMTTNNLKEDLSSLIIKINEGWLPSD